MNLFHKNSSTEQPASPSSVKHPETEPYENAHAHLLDELRWLNRLLAAHVLRLRRVNFYDRLKNFRDFFIADEEIDALLTAGIFEADGWRSDDERGKLMARLMRQAQDLRQKIGRRTQEALTQNVYLPLVHLTRSFHLSEFEQQVLLICLAPQIDARYEKLYAYLQNDLAKKSASIDLILGLLCTEMAERLACLRYFHPGAPLRHFGLVENGDTDHGNSTAQHSLRASLRILHHALGNAIIDERLASEARFLPPLSWEKVVINSALRRQLLSLFSANGQDSPTRRILYLHGRRGLGKQTIARALCSENHLPLLAADVRPWLAQPDTFQEKLRLFLREGLLQPCAVFIAHLEKLEQAAEEMPWLREKFFQEIAELGWRLLLASEIPLPASWLSLPEIVPVAIPAPDSAEQQALWRLHLNGFVEAGDLQPLEELTTRFDLNGGQIAGAVQHARQAGRLANPAGTPITLRDLFRSSRIQSQPKLSALARRIEPKYSWQDLVLPEDQMLQLREIADQVKFRHVVLHDWGFAGKLSLGRGINALFAGPSGTGKTMAAEVLANDLGLDLYKIDLSAVVSKYIGETEKNLNRIFTEAERSNAILFFDEADALFGKRSEVRDSHDRYANIEIAYLLQKMEEYEGLVILATNLKKNMDDAFVRRLQYVVDLPFPDEKYRHRIWSAIFPSSTPLSEEIDFKLLAKKLKITGGNIKNIGLKAAYLAAAEGGVVRMQHVVRATKREFQKMGKLYVESDFYREGKVLD